MTLGLQPDKRTRQIGLQYNLVNLRVRKSVKSVSSVAAFFLL
jgi:hypothetical protein